MPKQRARVLKFCTLWELGIAARTARSEFTEFLYRNRASSSAPPLPAPPPPPLSAWCASEEAASPLKTPFEECEGPLAIEVVVVADEEEEDVVDHKAGLQSSSFMEERIWKADSMVSSRSFWPSIASTCVVFGLVIAIAVFSSIFGVCLWNIPNLKRHKAYISLYKNLHKYPPLRILTG